MKERIKDETEQKVLRAAKVVFIRKGMDGARMQEIADEAQINKAMLHYYFRSKDRLFNAVLNDVFQELFPRIPPVILSDISFNEKVRWIVGEYIDLLARNPFLPGFVLHELNRNPDRFYKLFEESGFDSSQIMKHLQLLHGIPFDSRHFLANFLGMAVFPFLARPLLSKVLFKTEIEYTSFLQERKSIITQTLLKSIKP